MSFTITPIVARNRAKVKPATRHRVTKEKQTPAPTGLRHYQFDPSTQRWRRKEAPPTTRPDLWHTIISSRPLENSNLTISEARGLLSFIAPALGKRYGARDVRAEGFWHPHGWAPHLSADAFAGLDGLLLTIKARLGALLDGGNNDVIEDHCLIATMAADLAEAAWLGAGSTVRA